jgi:hypothetical protein
MTAGRGRPPEEQQPRRPRPARRATTAVVAIAVAAALVGVGCSVDDEDRFRAAAEKAATSTTSTTGPTSQPAPPGVPTGPATGEPSATAAPATTAPPEPPTALLMAVDALRAATGAAPALRFTTHFPVDAAPYASLQSPDPANPASVDERDWRDGRVSQPEPVRLTPADDLPTELFDMGSIDWAAVAATLPGAPALVEQQTGRPLEGSRGVTHLIAESGRPFTDGTVVRVYVDGGPRTTGGYVQLRPDGSVARVMV